MATTAATTTTTTASALRMKLLVDTKAQRVLFAEAGKDVVDFLFSLLAVPLATAVELVGEESVAGSAGNVYASIEGLDDTYILLGAVKSALLRPPAVASPASSASSSLLLPAPAPPQPKAFFKCTVYMCNYVTDARGTSCPVCKNPMTRPVSYAKPPAGPPGGGGSAEQKAQADPAVAAQGFVKGVVTYTVTDNLTVAPMSAISSISLLLNTFAVGDLSDLREKTVQLGYNEGLAILKASMQSKTVLTDVFLGSKA